MLPGRWTLPDPRGNLAPDGHARPLAGRGRLPEAVTADGRTQRLRPGQVQEELILSVLSILVFAAQATGLVTTPVSAYCFHPVESFLPGAVMPLALVFHAFSPLALIGLTIMSLMLNVTGHLPHEQVRRAIAFVVPHSRYHNRHHRDFRTHYAFSFPLLDRWFGGSGGPVSRAAP